NSTRIGVQFLESAGQRIRIAGEVRARGISLILPGTRDSELNQACGDRSDDQHKQGAEASAASAVVPVSATVSAEDHGPTPHAGEHRDGACDCGGDGADQYVAVLHMSEFMREHAFEFFIVEQ